MSAENEPMRESPQVLLRLYVAGNSPRSLVARANLEALCQGPLGGKCRVEIIDVLDEPLRLLRDGIGLTPALVRVSPPPLLTMMGDLSDRMRVLSALGLTPPPP